MIPDSILSLIGHTEYGLRTGLRPRGQLYLTGGYQRHVYVDCRPDKRVTGWTLLSGTTWQAPAGFFYDNQVLDVVRCRSNLGYLRRRETLAQCQANQGSYYFDPEAAASLWNWDDGSTLWDTGGVTWDSDPVLYVNLPGGVNPNDNVVVAIVGIYVSNVEVVQPSFGDDLTTDPGLEAYSGGRFPTLTNYTSALAGTGLDQGREGVDVMQGQFASNITATAASAGATFALSQDLPGGVVPGKPYWFEGFYKTNETNPLDLFPQIAIGDYVGNRWVRENGRSATVTQYHTLPQTYGEWLRWSFPFIMPTGAGDLRLLFRVLNTTAGSSGVVRWDMIRVRRIWRWNYYYPWLPPGGLPAVDVGRKDGFYGNWTYGLGDMKMLNAPAQGGGGKLNSIFTRFNWMGQEIVVRSGGRFPGGGNEVLFDNVGVRYVGLAGDQKLNDQYATVPMAEQRDTLKLQIPLDTYNTTNYPAVHPRWSGRGRGIVFGNSVDNLTPTRIGLRTDGLPIMEVAARCDLTSGSPKVRVYVDENAAAIRNLNRAVTPTSAETPTTGILGNASGTFLFNEVPGPFEILGADNDALEFRGDGVDYVAYLTPGLYRLTANGNAAQGLVPHVESKLDGTPAADFTVDVVVVGTNHFVRITYAGAALTLRTGSNVITDKHRSAWKTLGFTSTTDLTGALTYTADTPIWTAANEEKLVVRVDEVCGVADDGAGTYTGTPGARIVYGPDISYYLLRDVLKFGDHQFNLADLTAARAAATQELQLIVGALDKGRHEAPESRKTLAEYFTQIETSNRMDIYIDSGQWRWQVRDGVVPSSILTVEDQDIIQGSWETWLEKQDVFYVVAVQYLKDPSEGTWRSSQATNAGTPYEHGRWEDRTFPTCLKQYGDVLNLLYSLAAQAVAPIRHFRFITQGKTFEVPVGQKLRHNRSEGMTNPDGVVGPVVMRLLGKRDDAQGHRSEVRGMTDVG